MKKTWMSLGGLLLLVAGVQLALAPLFAQRQQGPRPSPKASVSQTIGVNTNITVTYGRPGVKGRVIWGKLVPYNKVWRTGANENTAISFSGPVKVNGHDLAAGTYGLHTIPTEDEWTIILSNKSDLWGSFGYKDADDALRVNVKSESSEFEERLLFTFEDLQDYSATVVLRWEKLKVSFKVETQEKA